MGQRIIGIDLGAHSVKLAEVDVGFNAVRVLHLRTLAVQPGPEPAIDRSLQALREMSKPEAHIDAVATALPGDRLLLRVLDIPFTDERKAAAVVGNELADDLPWELEEVIFDHAALGAVQGKVLAAVARSEEVRAFLGELAAMGLEPRSLPPAPLCYGGLVRRVAPSGTVLVVDLGHCRTNLCLLQNGRPLAARTISRGGHQITEAFRQAFQLSYAEAEAMKEQQAVLLLEGAAGAGAGGDPAREIAALTAQATAPLIREVQLTLGLYSSKLGLRPERVLLCGGTSRLTGLDTYLSASLGLPVERLRLDASRNTEIELPEAGQAVGALALGLALEQGGRQRLDLRQGEFAYRTDRSVLKDKILTIAVSVVLVLVFAALNAYVSLRALQKEEAALTAQLKRATQMVFGKPVLNPTKVSRDLKSGSRAVSSGIPERTAFDILQYLSAEVPGADKVKLDITRLEIKPGKTYITATADTRSGVGDIVKALEKNKCFSKLSTGTISDVAEGKKQFTLTINTECF